MDVLKGLNLRGFFRFLDSKCDAEFVEWLQAVGLLHSKRVCPSCGELMKFYKKDPRGNGKMVFLWRCMKRKCSRRPKIGFYKGTFFEEHKLALKEIFMFSYFWVHGMSSHKTLEREFRREENGSTLGKESAALYRKLFSDVCVEFFLRNPVKIGGANVIIEVDESLIVSKRKYNVGRLPIDMRAGTKQWFFGGVERGNSENCFIVPIANQTASTLCSAIARYVEPGSVIMHDGLASYQSIDRMKVAYEHHEVLHKYNFVDPENSDVYTQSIESAWAKFKHANRNRGGTHRHLFMLFLSEYLWKKKFAGPDALYWLWKHVCEVFVCVDGEITIRQVFDCEWEYDVFEE